MSPDANHSVTHALWSDQGGEFTGVIFKEDCEEEPHQAGVRGEILASPKWDDRRSSEDADEHNAVHDAGAGLSEVAVGH